MSAIIEPVYNGGSVGQTLLSNGFNVHSLRPFIAKDGRAYVSNAQALDPENASLVQNGQIQTAIPVQNATLRRLEWTMLDNVVQQTAKFRLRIVQDLLSRGLTYNVPNALGVTTLEYQSMSDSRTAQTSLDGLNRSTAQRPEFDLTGVPLMITHSDFQFSAREIENSRRMGMTIDTAQAENATRAVSEQLEAIFWGTAGNISAGGRNLYGITTFPYILSNTFTGWDATGKTAAQMLQDVINMKQASISNKRFGPWVLYIPVAWENYLDMDYNSTAQTTLRDRIMKIDGIQDIAIADYMPTRKLALIQMSNDVIQCVNGITPTLVQWPGQGGLELNFKILSIMVPRIRADYNKSTGIVVWSAT